VKNFALIGAAGYVAPRHLMAIQKTGNRLVAAVDPHDSVGVLDRTFPDARFFTEIERFDRFLEKERRLDRGEKVDLITICSPNYLHDAHVRLALRVHAEALCEKPLVVSPWNLDQLAELEQEHGRRVHTVLQLRLHPDLVALEEKLHRDPPRERTEVNLTYVTRRGPWYHTSWKGSAEKSGGLAMNIGVHFFDMLMWLFGPPERSEVHLAQRSRMAGLLELERARVRWFLSVNAEDLPRRSVEADKPAFRSLTINGEELEFSNVFEDLHVRVYEETLAGRGFGIEDARPSIELVHAIRTATVTSPSGVGHPWLVSGAG
jgi:UDP-N-acetyl-2-amino-2-deoxyglucuronate dehydrogenase